MKLLTMARRWHALKRFVTEQFSRRKEGPSSKVPILIRTMHPSEKDEMMEVLWKAFDPDPMNLWLDEQAAKRGKEKKTKEFHEALLNATHVDVLDDKSGIAMYQQINKRSSPSYSQPVVATENPVDKTVVKSNHAQSNLQSNETPDYGGGDQFVLCTGGSSRQEMGMDVDAVQIEIEQQAPPPPYTYLSFLGVDPSRKGTGAGGALLKHHLARKFDWVLSDLTGEEQDNIITNKISTATIAPLLALLTTDSSTVGSPQAIPIALSQTPSQIPILALWTSDPVNVGFYERYGLTVYSVCTVDGVDRAWWMTNGRGRL